MNYKEYYTQLAYKNACIDATAWNPELGFKKNYDLMLQLYIYYQQLYIQRPSKFLWMGLARLTGGQVLWGMHNLCRIAKDPSCITQHIVHIAKDIFEDLAWQHEMYIHEPEQLLHYLKTTDSHTKYKPSALWNTIHTGSPQEIAEANMHTLHNEQLLTIQKHYDIIREDSYSKRYLFFTRFTMRNIHPYHNRFIVDVPFKDVTVFIHRWQWISKPKGMWDTWIHITEQERTRLVMLSNKEVMEHRW